MWTLNAATEAVNAALDIGVLPFFRSRVPPGEVTVVTLAVPTATWARLLVKNPELGAARDLYIEHVRQQQSEQQGDTHGPDEAENASRRRTGSG